MTTQQNNTTRKRHREQLDVYDLFIFVLSVLSLILLLFFELERLYAVSFILNIVNSITCIFFLINFIRHMCVVEDRWHYFVLWGWLDLLSSIPLPMFNVARIPRTLYIGMILQSLSLADIKHIFTRRLAVTALLSISLLGLITVTVGSIIVFLVEHNVPDTRIHTASDALWWAFISVTTVGYGDFYPVTIPGRIIATLLIMIGIGLVTIMTSYFATVFLSHVARESDYLHNLHTELQDLRHEVRTLHAETTAIKQLLQKHTPNPPPDKPT